jgi:dihydropteroate synthase
MKLECRGKIVDLSSPAAMGILNVTPDSFSDGGQFATLDAAVRHAREMVEQGAAIIDVGGESTRPGAAPVSVEQEIERVVPIIAALAPEIGVPISIDTQKPAVMRAAIAAGAGMINDVNALRAPGALEAARDLAVPVCLMHMRGEPRTMQRDPVYRDVVAEVLEFLEQRVAACVAAGIPRARLVVDPGFGFGKSLDHNLTLLRELKRFVALGVPVLVGTSRKSMLAAMLGGAPPEERVFGGIALSVLAVEHGASIIRTHDVRATADALKVLARAQRAE